MKNLKIADHLYIFIALLISLVAGCASAPKQEINKVFYPPPPDAPRLQYLTHFNGETDIVAKKSAFAAFITGAQESKRRLDKPYGLAVANGKIYVADVNEGVIVFDLEKREYGGLQGAGGMGKLVQPINIRIDSEGNKYVSDPIRGQVVVFDKNDFYVTAFGMPENWKPVDAVPYQGELFVADMKNGEIAVLNKKDGTLQRRFGQIGEIKERLSRPTNLAFDSEGHLFVSDAGRFQILKYDRDGHFMGTIGEIGKESGTFARPRGIAIDRKQRIYAVDAAFGNVQIFDKDGFLLGFFGTTGYNPGDMNLPSQVVVDYDNIKYFQKFADPNFVIENLVIVANQFGNRMISVYALGKERGKNYPSEEELIQKLKTRIEKTNKEQPSGKKAEPDKEKK